MKKERTILISENIFTGMADHPRSGAVVIDGDRIAAVVEKDCAADWSDEGARVIDLGDQLVCPGFVDNHVFFTGYVWSRIGADLSGAGTKSEAALLLEEYAQDKTEGGIFGHGLRAEALEEDADDEELLKVFGSRPVVAFTEDRDGCMMNRAAKDAYGFDGSEVYAEICWKVFDEFLRDEKFIRREYENFSRLLASRGVTSIKEIGFDSYSGFVSILKEMEAKDELLHRVNLVSQPVGRPADFEFGRKCAEELHSDFLQFMGYNIMVDGEIAAHNADVIDEYRDLPGSRGEQEIDYESLEKMALKADAMGLRCAFHAEGDNAVRRTVDIFEHCREINGDRDARHVITDLEMVRPEELKRMAELGITACNYVQIMECLGGWEEFYGYDRVGENGIKNYWPYKRMLDLGVHACCGTDLPLTEPDIPLSAYLTVTRKFPDGKPEEGINKDCALTVGQILKMWTVEGQYANFREDRLGTLEEGKLADIAVIDRNLFGMEPEKLKEAQVSMTICAGKTVYVKEE